MQYEEKLGKITSYVHKWLTLREPPSASVRPCSLNFPQLSGCMYAWINMKAVDQQSISLDPPDSMFDFFIKCRLDQM